jgi:hypothetical protein
MYARHRPRLEDFVAAVHPVEGQVGALFAVNGSPWGMDLFDSPATLGKTLPKLVRSYALDAIDVATDKAMPVLEQEALRFLISNEVQPGSRGEPPRALPCTRVHWGGAPCR